MNTLAQSVLRKHFLRFVIQHKALQTLFHEIDDRFVSIIVSEMEKKRLLVSPDNIYVLMSFAEREINRLVKAGDVKPAGKAVYQVKVKGDVATALWRQWYTGVELLRPLDDREVQELVNSALSYVIEKGLFNDYKEVRND